MCQISSYMLYKSKGYIYGVLIKRLISYMRLTSYLLGRLNVEHYVS
jgi:hypothetical protein